MYTVALRELHAGFSLTLAQVVPNSCCHGTRPATQHDADLLVRCPSPVALSPPLSCATWWLLRPSQPVQPRHKTSVALKVFHRYIFVCNSYICSASLSAAFPYPVAIVERHTFCYPWIPSFKVVMSPLSNQGLRPWFDGGAQNDSPVHDRMC